MKSARPHGFAALSPEQRADLGRKGGKKAHQDGTAHRWDATEAAQAGRKGGQLTQFFRKSAAEQERGSR